METESRAVPNPWIVPVLAAGALVVSFLGLGAAKEARESAERAHAEARAASKAADSARESAKKAADGLAELRADIEMLATSMGAVERNVKTLSDRIDFGPGGGNPFAGADAEAMAGPPRQKVIEFTPELRESLRKAVAAKGVKLLEDRVEFPAVVVLRQGQLEYFAVLPGGKTHESIFSFLGETADGERIEGLGAALNSSLMALGLKPGTPLKLLPNRAVPATGTTVHIAVEWEEEGKAVRVRAEDLLWDRERSRTMEEGKFIYVGSFFGEDGYIPDLVGDAVAVYSVSTCVVDLDDPRAANDMVFVACAPRIPPEGTKVRIVFSPQPLPPTRTWDPKEPEKRTDGAAPGGSGGK